MTSNIVQHQYQDFSIPQREGDGYVSLTGMAPNRQSKEERLGMIKELPALSLSNKDLLPSYSGVYAVVGRRYCFDQLCPLAVLYVGRSKDLNKRWRSHHKLRQIKARCIDVSIHYSFVPESHLRLVESNLCRPNLPFFNSVRPHAKNNYTTKEVA